MIAHQRNHEIMVPLGTQVFIISKTAILFIRMKYCSQKYYIRTSYGVSDALFLSCRDNQINQLTKTT